MHLTKIIFVRGVKKIIKGLLVNNRIPFGWSLDFVVSAYAICRWMSNHASPDHIEIDIDKTFYQILISLNCCCMISIFSECTLSVFMNIVLLSGPAGYRLKALGDPHRYQRRAYECDLK